MHNGPTRRAFLKAAGATAAAAGAGGIFAPAILRDQRQPIKIGHLIPQSGFLSPMGEYMIKGATLAAEELNAAGGVLGREVRLIPEDDMNPGLAVQEATKLIQQEKVDALMGTVSSTVCLAVMDVADRANMLLVNTGSNSDESRGKRCNYYTFSVEGSNSQYVNTIGRYLIKEKQYKRWYFLTSDYAFGHDLLRVSRGLLKKMGGAEVGGELIPTFSMEPAEESKEDLSETAVILATLVAHQQTQRAAHIIQRGERDTSNWKWVGRWERMHC